MPWTTPETFTAGQTLTAASMNVISGNLSMLATVGNNAAWTSYTPTLAQGASSDVSKTVTYARWQQVGRIVTVSVVLAITGAGSAGSAITVSLPVTMNATLAAATDHTIGVGSYLRSGTGRYYTNVCPASSTTAQFQYNGDATGSMIGIGPSFALSNGSQVSFTAQYEAAA